MPAEGVQLTPSSALLSHAELLRLAGLFVEAGVSKIRLTGGEPTVYPNLVGLCEGLTVLPGLQTLAMTTNGIKLSRQLPDLQRAGGRPRGRPRTGLNVCVGCGSCTCASLTIFPPATRPLHTPGLSALNISLDTLQPARFEVLARRQGHARVLKAIDTAVELGYDPVKVE